VERLAGRHCNLTKQTKNENGRPAEGDRFETKNRGYNPAERDQTCHFYVQNLQRQRKSRVALSPQKRS